MEAGEYKFVCFRQPQRIWNGEINPDSPDCFDREGEADDIEQGGEQGVHGLGIDHVAYEQLVVDRCGAAEEQGEEAGECKDSYAAYLEKHGKHRDASRGERRRDVDRCQAGDAHRRGGDEQ